MALRTSTFGDDGIDGEDWGWGLEIGKGDSYLEYLLEMMSMLRWEMVRYLRLWMAKRMSSTFLFISILSRFSCLIHNFEFYSFLVSLFLNSSF